MFASCVWISEREGERGIRGKANSQAVVLCCQTQTQRTIVETNEHASNTEVSSSSHQERSKHLFSANCFGQTGGRIVASPAESASPPPSRLWTLMWVRGQAGRGKGVDRAIMGNQLLHCYRYCVTANKFAGIKMVQKC